MAAVLATVAAVAAEVETPAGLSVAVFRFSAGGVDAAAADLLTDDVVEEVRASGAFVLVVSPNEVDTRIGVQGQQQLRDCALDRCALVDRELAGALGVTHLLVGSVARLGEQVGVSLKLVELRTAAEIATVRRDVARAEALPREVRAATRALLAQAHLVPAAVAMPQDAAAASPPRAMLWGLGVAGGVAGAVLAVLGVTVAGVLNGAVLMTWFVYPLPTPTQTYQQRVNLLRGTALGGAAVGGGLGALALLAFGAATVGVVMAVVGM